MATIVVDLVLEYSKRFREHRDVQLTETDKHSELTLRDVRRGVQRRVGLGGGVGASDRGSGIEMLESSIYKSGSAEQTPERDTP